MRLRPRSTAAAAPPGYDGQRECAFGTIEQRVLARQQAREMLSSVDAESEAPAAERAPMPRQPSGVRSVSRRFSYAFIGVITLILVAFAAAGVFLNMARIDTEIRNRLDNALQMAQTALPIPLWNLDNEVVKDFLGTLFLDESIVIAQIYWGGETLTEKKRSAYQDKTIDYFANLPDFIVKKADIQFQESYVGSIVVVVSREAVRNQAIFQVSAIIFLTLLIIVAISVTSVVITRRYISRPLSSLRNSAALIAGGNLDASIEIGSQDEIGCLAQDLDAMRGSIKDLVGALREAKETLEQKVEKRTRQLADANADLTETLEQQTATSEVLGVISRSPTDAQPVFNMIAESAARLCRGQFCGVSRFDGDRLHLAGSYGHTGAALQAYESAYPRRPDEGSAAGRAILTRSIAHIPDVAADPDYGRTVMKVAQAVKMRSVVSVPMLRDGRPIGAITVSRSVAAPFADKQIELLKTFADQAVIAIENMRVFQALEARTSDLTHSVEELEALSEVSQTVSSSLDRQSVLTSIVRHATRLSKTEAGTIYEFDEAEKVFIPRANDGLSEELIEALRDSRLHVGDGTVVGQAAVDRLPAQIPDLLKTPEYALPLVQQAGFRALLAVPLTREEHVIGSLVVRRKAAGEFPEATVNLLQTFAAQSVTAIQNARLFQEIQKKSRELEIASRHKSQFLANMSHELRTPLNSIIGFSEVLLEKMFGTINEKQEEYLDDILTSGKHLLNLINDILDLSKIEAGKMELELGSVDLHELLEGSLVVVKERALTHGIRLSLDMSEDIGTLVADERKVKQVVFNLLSNAVKFTRDSGQVGIRAHRSDELAEIAVWDTGVGISPANQKRIFEEFQQVGQGLTGKPEGTGLGLTLSRKLVELHGGTIRVESVPGQGSTFTFTLPTADNVRRVGLTAGQEEAVAKGIAPTPSAGPPVLVIEDDPKAVELLRIYLGEAGHKIETAKDGEEGLEKAKELSPAAIILDVLLPKVDGWDFLTKVKADAATRNIPVIIVSILDQKGKGFALGAADYLVKPIEKNALLKSLDAFGLSSKPRAEPIKVLAIDDDPKAVELVAATLEPEGFRVLKTYSGEEGIETATAEQPDIIVLDLLMPGMNGFEVLERLKASPATRKLPVVLFTVKHLTADEKQRLKGRIVKLAQKDEYTPQRLVGIVREVLQGTLQG